MVPLESQTVVEKNPSTSVDAAKELDLTKDQNTSTTVVEGASSLTSPTGVQEQASFMGKGGEHQFGYQPNVYGYQPNVYAPQPHTPFSGGYLNHLGQWEGYPYAVSSEGLDAAYPVMYGVYSPLSAIGYSQTYFSLLCPMPSPCYQPPASPSMGYSSPGTGQFDPLPHYYFPDKVHYSPTPGFYQPFGSFNGVPMQFSGVPGFFEQGNTPLASRMESMSNSGSYKAFQQGGKFGGSTQSWSTASCRFGTFNNGFKNENGSRDFLNEQCRGPRATKTQKEVENSSAEDKNKKTLPLADSDRYNHPGFVTEYKDAKFFVIKSYTEDHIHKSIKYNVWASTPTGNRKLNAAYREAKEKEDHCPIFLFFSVNNSGQFCGVAEMTGPVDFDMSVDYWRNSIKWSGQFPVKWHIVKDVPNNFFWHIILENNGNKRVTYCRDTQEVKLEQGLQMLAIFKNHEAKTSILEDFEFYEQREKAMLDDRQQQKQQCSKTGRQVQASAPVDIVTISDAFAEAVQLEETNDKENKPMIRDAAAAENVPAAPVKIEEGHAENSEVGGLLKESG